MRQLNSSQRELDDTLCQLDDHKLEMNRIQQEAERKLDKVGYNLFSLLFTYLHFFLTVFYDLRLFRMMFSGTHHTIRLTVPAEGNVAFFRGSKNGELQTQLKYCSKYEFARSLLC